VRGCFSSYCLAEFVGASISISVTLNFIIDFFASGEVFLSWVSTNGGGAISSLGFALFNIIWI